MKNDREYFGTLTGFTDSTDSNLALVLQDVKEYTYEGGNGSKYLINESKVILLNGTHITVMVPGDDEPTPRAVNEK